MLAPFADPVVDWGALLEMLWASVVGGVGVTSAFAVAILGTTRAVDLRRDGHGLAASVYGVLAVVALVAVAAAVVLGIVFMTSKD